MEINVNLLLLLPTHTQKYNFPIVVDLLSLLEVAVQSATIARGFFFIFLILLSLIHV